MTLHTVDWIIAAACILLCFLPAFAFGKRASKNTTEFFALGPFGPVVAGWHFAGRDHFFERHAEPGRELRANTGRSRQLAVVGVHADRRRHGVFLCAAVAALRAC